MLRRPSDTSLWTPQAGSAKITASTGSLSATTNLPSIGSFTMAGWFKQIGSGGSFGWGACVLGSTTTQKYYLVGTNAQTNGNYIVYNGTSNGANGPVIIANQWNHMAMVVDSSGTIFGYLNGQLSTSVATDPTMTAAKMFFGNDVDSDFLSGAMAHLTVWNRPLYTPEVVEHMIRPWGCVLDKSSSLKVGLNRYLPCDQRIRFNKDQSPFKFDMTTGGTLSFHGGPPIILPSGMRDEGRVPSGSTAFTAPLSESVSATEAKVILFAAKVTGLAESESVTESEATKLGAKVQLSESEAVTESAAEKFAARAALSESEALTESEASKWRTSVALSESETESEAIAEVYGQKAALSESEAVTEAAGEVFRAHVPLPETATVTEASTESHGMSTRLSESETVTEAQAAKLGAKVPASESAAVTEAEATTFRAKATLSESEGVTEARTATLKAKVTASESEAVVEAEATAFRARAALSESETVTEARAAKVAAKVALAESGALAEALAVIYRAKQALSDSEALIESIETSTNGSNLFLSEAVTVSEAVGVIADLRLVLAEAESIVEAVNARQAARAPLAESVTAVEALREVLGARAHVSESASMSEAASAVLKAVASLSEPVTASESIAERGRQSLALSESATLIEGITAQILTGAFESSLRRIKVVNYSRLLTVLQAVQGIQRTIVVQVEERTIRGQMKIYSQFPNAQLDYTVDWSDWLETNETIASVTWTVGSGLTIAAQTNDDTTATVFLLATGTIGSPNAKVTCTVTATSSPTRRDSRVFFIKFADV